MSLPFPAAPASAPQRPRGSKWRGEFVPESAENVLAALENVSRRIDDLARELNCLGYFDDDDNRPRAA